MSQCRSSGFEPVEKCVCNMKIEGLPFDVWQRIVDLGNLSRADVVNLMSLSRELYGTLRHNSIWFRLYKRYCLEVQLDYEVESAQRVMCHRKGEDFYKLCMEFEDDYTKFVEKLNGKVENRAIDGPLSVIYFYYTIHHTPRNEETFLTRISTVSELLMKHGISLALRYLLSLDEDDYEKFWFHVGLFDKDSFKLIRYRRLFYEEVYQLLHQEIDLTGCPHIAFVQRPGTKHLLVFDTFDDIMTLIEDIMQVALSMIRDGISSISTYEAYYKDSYFEDFSIFRVYFQQTIGHPFLIMSIMIKILNEFLLNKYELQVKGSEVVDLKMGLTENYLRIENRLYSFSKANLLAGPRRMVSFTVAEYESILRARNIRDALWSLRPVSFHDMVNFYFEFLKAKPISTIFNIDPTFLKAEAPYHNLYTTEYFKCIRLIYKHIKSGPGALQGLHEPKFPNSLREVMTLDCKILFDAMYAYTGEETFNIGIQDILDMTPFTRGPMEGTFGAGCVIFHQRMKKLGIILGAVPNTGPTKYYRVFTMLKTVECYSEASITRVNNIDTIHRVFSMICSYDTTAYLFKKISISGDNVKFIAV